MREVRFLIDILFDVKFIRASSSRCEIQNLLKNIRKNSNFWQHRWLHACSVSNCGLFEAYVDRCIKCSQNSYVFRKTFEWVPSFLSFPSCHLPFSSLIHLICRKVIIQSRSHWIKSDIIHCKHLPIRLKFFDVSINFHKFKFCFNFDWNPNWN